MINLIKGLFALALILIVHAAAKEWRTGREETDCYGR